MKIDDSAQKMTREFGRAKVQISDLKTEYNNLEKKHREMEIQKQETLAQLEEMQTSFKGVNE